MERILHNGQDGIFIPMEAYVKGKFFDEFELHELQRSIVKQKQLLTGLKE